MSPEGALNNHRERTPTNSSARCALHRVQPYSDPALSPAYRSRGGSELMLHDRCVEGRGSGRARYATADGDTREAATRRSPWGRDDRQAPLGAVMGEQGERFAHTPRPPTPFPRPLHPSRPRRWPSESPFDHFARSTERSARSTALVDGLLRRITRDSLDNTTLARLARRSLHGAPLPTRTDSQISHHRTVTWRTSP